ncbi:Uncharacterised protein [Pragia fontium]|uniref:hypothetical protein n=1 Tax=Pragia fontium TaxID=82985 RepID=UPI000E064B7E|nr:hypothetical protein [Pragia fontium]SUB81994.1 Uncharacterised protein [Pragia fontium]
MDNRELMERSFKQADVDAYREEWEMNRANEILSSFPDSASSIVITKGLPQGMLSLLVSDEGQELANNFFFDWCLMKAKDEYREMILFQEAS